MPYESKSTTHSSKCSVQVDASYSSDIAHRKSVTGIIERFCRRDNIIKKLNDDISIRKGKYGPYVFYKTSTMNRPKFISMKGIAQEEVTIAWVEANLNN